MTDMGSSFEPFRHRLLAWVAGHAINQINQTEAPQWDTIVRGYPKWSRNGCPGPFFCDPLYRYEVCTMYEGQSELTLAPTFPTLLPGLDGGLVLAHEDAACGNPFAKYCCFSSPLMGMQISTRPFATPWTWRRLVQHLERFVKLPAASAKDAGSWQ